jgi:hypothetical protein
MGHRVTLIFWPGVAVDESAFDAVDGSYTGT